MSLSNVAKSALAGVFLAIAALPLVPSTVSAWEVNHSAHSKCVNEKAVINWSFKNEEPNQAKWSMDVLVTDSQSGASTTHTVAAGQTVTGTLDPNQTKIGSGYVSFKMTWTDGRSGVDTRKSNYNATEDCDPFEEPEFSAHTVCKVADGVGVFTLRVQQTGGDGPVTFDPSDGTVLPNGDPVTVTATYNDGTSTKTKSVRTTQTDDCTPPEEEIEVCRDGEVITIKESERLPSDTNPPCPEKEIEVCRDGEMITIKESEKKDSDTDACVKGETTELPNTGAGSVVGLLGATFAGGTAFAQYRMRRNR